MASRGLMIRAGSRHSAGTDVHARPILELSSQLVYRKLWKESE